MATDASGTPTSPDNIPTYATSGDAPSGKGFNAAMALIQTALSARISKPGTPVTNNVLTWNGTTWASSPASGFEYDYAQNITVGTINVTATTSGTAQSVVTGNSVTYDGSTAVMLEAFVGDVQPDTTTANRRTIVAIFDNGTLLYQFGLVYSQVAGQLILASPYAKFKLTPTAGAHIYSVRSWVTAGTGVIGTGIGGAGDTPAWLRVTKA